jgi:predicted AlkP superfamily pyrophosphatase or phosphodiesterase
VINQDSVAAVDASRWREHFVKPLYGSYCFSRIPQLIESVFDAGDASVGRELLGPLAGRYNKVILLFIDGYGWPFVQETLDRYLFLRRFADDGVVTKLTSQFPSTTSVHVTTIHTGLDVGESGIYEWFMYEPSLDGIITSLPFSWGGELEPGTLIKEGIRPETIFPSESIHQRLASHGVRSVVWGSKEFTPSPVTTAMTTGAEVRPFGTLRAGLMQLADALQSDDGPAFYYLYSGTIDYAGHKSGPSSSAWRMQADLTFHALEDVVLPALRNRTDTILLLTADHGQIACDPNKTILVNRIYPELGRWFQTTSKGAPILPTGNFRDMVLHIQPEHLEEARTGLQERLGDQAAVVTVQELIDLGFFGHVTERLTRRIGNLMVLPVGNRLVWWEGYSTPRFRGYHGGLAPEEMETQLLAWAPG